MAKILILDCDYDIGIDNTTDEIVRIITRENSGNFTIHKYRVCENIFPELNEVTNYDSIIISGSNADVYDDIEWIYTLETYIKEIIKKELPLLGICFGHQLICKVLGCKVVRSLEKKVRYTHLEITHEGENDPLFRNINNPLFFESHSYLVKDIVEGISILAKDDFCIQAIRYGQRVYGVQFHPEIGIGFAKRILTKSNREHDDMLLEDEKEIYDSRRTRLLINFVDPNNNNNNNNDNTPTIKEVLISNKQEFGLILDINYRNEKSAILDFSKNNNELVDMDFHSEKFTRWINDTIIKNNAKLAIGKYDEDRLIYQQSSLFKGKESRTIQLGIDLCVPVRTKVSAPIEGIIHSYKNNNCKGDYGPTIILEHNFRNRKFYTLYGHLSLDSLENVYKGQKIQKGGQIGYIGNSDENGNWNPHLHFQIIDDMLGKEGDFYGVINQSQRNRFIKICPNPNIILQIPSLSN